MSNYLCSVCGSERCRDRDCEDELARRRRLADATDKAYTGRKEAPTKPLTPKQRLRATAERLFPGIGCYDGSCIWGSAGGMQTNGGCSCLKGIGTIPEARMMLRKMRRAALELAKENT